MKIISAEYVLPISAEPIKNGAICIENGKILDVGSKKTLAEKYPEAEYEDFGKSAISPGFVNCHSHLEITAMRGYLDEFDGDFSSWLVKLTKTRAEKLSFKDIKLAALLGGLEGVKAGVTCFGDIGREGAAGVNALKKNGLRGILFQETEFSPDNASADEDFVKLTDKFEALRADEDELVKVGISPHSPYTVSRKLFGKISAFAIANGVKTTIHAAESQHEKNLLEKGEGFFAEIYSEQNVSWESPKCSTIEYLSKIGVMESQPLLAHCVTVSPKDIETIKQSGSKIAHCPKSNAKFGHGIAPLGKFFDGEIAIGIGSDSVASNNTCDILEEARFATLVSRVNGGSQRFLQPDRLLKAMTLGGAAALGMENEIGSVEAGKQADIIVISLENVAQAPIHDIHSTLIFSSNAKDIKATMVAGEFIYRDGKSLKIDEKELAENIEAVRAKMTES